MPSFEPRSTTALELFRDSGGKAEVVKAIHAAADQKQIATSLARVEKLGVKNIAQIDRFSSRQMWSWVWQNVKDVRGNVVIDATGFTRELVYMLLFGLSIRRNTIENIRVFYVPPGERGYVSTNQDLPKSKRWLSKGLVGIRSVIGYPGNFSSEKKLRVIALAGHETARLYDAIEFLEPNALSIAAEESNSSTVAGAYRFSKEAVEELKTRIHMPPLETFEFSANSIQLTYESICQLLDGHGSENLVLLPMNNKPSSIGAALAALYNRNARIVYAVPEHYNPKYSYDSGQPMTFDITDQIHKATSILT